jgi:hypothetical protein
MMDSVEYIEMPKMQLHNGVSWVILNQNQIIATPSPKTNLSMVHAGATIFGLTYYTEFQSAATQ